MGGYSATKKATYVQKKESLPVQGNANTYDNEGNVNGTILVSR